LNYDDRTNNLRNSYSTQEREQKNIRTSLSVRNKTQTPKKEENKFFFLFFSFFLLLSSFVSKKFRPHPLSMTHTTQKKFSGKKRKNKRVYESFSQEHTRAPKKTTKKPNQQNQTREKSEEEEALLNFFSSMVHNRLNYNNSHNFVQQD